MAATLKLKDYIKLVSKFNNATNQIAIKILIDCKRWNEWTRIADQTLGTTYPKDATNNNIADIDTPPNLAQNTKNPPLSKKKSNFQLLLTTDLPQSPPNSPIQSTPNQAKITNPASNNRPINPKTRRCKTIRRPKTNPPWIRKGASESLTKRTARSRL